MSAFTGYWAERAGRAEADADHLADLLARAQSDLREAEWREARELLTEYRTNRERRYRALTAGHTLEGSFKSGGWQ